MRPRRPAGVTAAVILALALGWLFFAPPQLGGRTTWTSTVGNSMEPLFHKGDLALSRPAATYHVGEIVLYESPVFHRPVLHRIVAVQRGHYFFKGDHNDFVDPGYATRGELVGRLWLRLPRLGYAVAWIGRPRHAAAVAGFAVLAALGGGPARRRRRRGRKRRGDRTVNRIRPHLHRPRRSAENAVAAAAAALGLATAVVAFTQPTARTTAVPGAYMHRGDFSYAAATVRPTPAYPTGRAATGDPLFLNDFKQVRVRFDYRFQSRLRHHIAGTITLRGLVSADSGWHQAYRFAAPVRFTGDRASITAVAPVTELRSLLTEVATDSGAVGASYTIELRPVVRVHGSVAAKRIDETFSPNLPFTATSAVLKLNPSAPTPLPGTTYDAADAQTAALVAGLHPSRDGSVPGRAPRMVSLGVATVADSTARGIALGSFGLALVALLLKPLRPRRDTWSHEQRVAFRHKVVLVDVVELDPLQASTDVPDIENLAVLAQYCERPILHAGTDFAVEDGGRLYVYRGQAHPATPSAVVVPRQASSHRRVRPLAGLLGLLAFVGIVGTGFTATTLVPASNAGATNDAAAASELEPTACTGTVSSIVRVPSGGATYTVASANTLILGTSGNDDVVAKSGYNCFLGGGPASANGDSFTGPTGGNDECVVASTAKTKNITRCSIVGRTP